jgi:trigger factor
MLVVQEPLSPCEVSLEIEVETDKVAQAVDRVYREYSQHITVPGFRKGKAPLSFVKQRVPAAQLRERAAEILVEPAYQEALKQESLSPFGTPKLELLTLEVQAPQTFKFKALVPLAPKVEPAPYVGVEMDRITQPITDELVDKRISQVQDGAATFPVVTDRGAQVGDVVAVEIAISPEEGDPVPPRNTVIRIGDDEIIPGLSDELVGLKATDHKHFSLTYPSDYPNPALAGTTAEFHIEVFEVHDRILPELNDDFALTHGKVETMELYRQALRDELEKTATENAAATLEIGLVDKIVEASQIDYPSFLLDQEVNEEVQNLLAELQRRKVQVEDHLAQIGLTAEQLTQEMSARSDQRLRRGLLIGDIARKEQLLLSDEDVEKEIAERAVEAGTSPESMKAYIDANKQNNLVRNTAQTKKVLAFLTSNAIITDKSPDPVAAVDTQAASPAVEDADPEATAAKPKTRKKKAEVVVAE